MIINSVYESSVHKDTLWIHCTLSVRCHSVWQDDFSHTALSDEDVKISYLLVSAESRPSAEQITAILTGGVIVLRERSSPQPVNAFGELDRAREVLGPFKVSLEEPAHPSQGLNY